MTDTITMPAESFSLESLTVLKHRRIAACTELQSRTRRRLVFARSEALELLAIEKPLEPPSERRRAEADVVVASTDAKTRLNGVRFLTWHGPLATIAVGRTLECTTPVCTWAHYAGILSLDELIVLGESMMRRNMRLTRAEYAEFVAYMDRAEDAGQFLGSRNCRRALNLMREGTDSSQETRTRLALMRYGLPEPLVNHPVLLSTGRTVLTDMAYPEARIAIEYDGGYHRFSSAQVLKDDKRREALERDEWIYVKATRLDLQDETGEGELAQRVASAFERVLGIPVPLTARMTAQQLCDGRRTRRKPIWERVPRQAWAARWAHQ
ncbi:hypothetical protein G1C96_1863 [Bifidobacterium sp. DSM 109958]|uniref:DUF559 domain-containing protein n=1 Tax=Bifidobacterium moraviense TaxID=2675323 RepID=A0A7Y0F541_9BIFI|nr:hypothetical protein [Bifidobacterium sp. DSM 109958]NMN01277.1 hypothetical protein [Bifidobacterium sp. DSM 109958]